MKEHFAITRRQGLLGLLAAGVSGLVPGRLVAEESAGGFTHGVASGDPGTDRVALWTRYVPPGGADEAALVLELATDSAFAHPVVRRQVPVTRARDFCVTALVDGLEADRRYFYRFRAGDGTTSVTGRTRTLPATPRPLKIAIVSCSNYPYGFFHVYRAIAAREDIDLVLHLGDYIYEYPAGKYGDPRVVAQGRQVRPEGELLTLADYRERYATYRSDPDLQAVHAAHPMVAIYDDHEAANDSWKNGAENHQPDEGDWSARRHAALRAWREWLPVTHAPAAPADSFYRRITAPGLLDLFILDTRLLARDRQLSYMPDNSLIDRDANPQLSGDMPLRTAVFDFSDPDHPRPVTDPRAARKLPPAAIRRVPIPFDMTGEKPRPILDWARIRSLDPKNLPQGIAYLPDIEAFRKKLWDPHRSMLGQRQEAWLAAGLAHSVKAGTPWQLIGQQVVMGRLVAPELMDIADFSKPSVINRQAGEKLQALARAGLPLNLDSWDGYPAARERFYDMLREAGAQAVVLSGDSHNAWAFDLADRNGRPAAVEFATPAVTSPGLAQYLPVPPEEMARRFVAHNPELVYFEPRWRGWIELTVTPEAVSGRFHYVSTVVAREAKAIAGPRFTRHRDGPVRLARG